jgi:hypothetical protein
VEVGRGGNAVREAVSCEQIAQNETRNAQLDPWKIRALCSSDVPVKEHQYTTRRDGKRFYIPRRRGHLSRPL